MQYGIVLTTADPRRAAELAAAAEAAGWDGVFTWDAIAIEGMECWDPWVTMAAMAMRTTRVRLGAVVHAPSRRRPWKLARETVSLDHLSAGRLVLPVGLGALDDQGFGAVGEATGARARAELLDETLAILDGLWTGRPFGFEGRHHRFPPLTFVPRPLQRPRIPVWVVGAWPSERSMARVARWDGWVAQPLAVTSGPTDWSPAALAAGVAWLRAHREVRPGGADRDDGFAIVAGGTTPAGDPAAAADLVRPWIEAGATWWLEQDWSASATPQALHDRVAAGPPRSDPPAR